MAINKTNINEIEETFAKLDLALICEEKYNTLKQFDWVVYAILKNQESLSKRSYLMGNRSYVDENNNVFIRISQKKLAKLLKTSEPTLRSSFNRLVKAELLEINVVGKNQCNIMYIGNPVRTITFGEYAESIGKSLEEEKEVFVPSINVDKVVNLKENKKASSTAIDEAQNTNISKSNNSINKSIPQNNKKDTNKNKNYKPNRFHNCKNKVLDYTEEELNDILEENEKIKKERKENDGNKKSSIEDFNIEEATKKALMNKEYFENLEDTYKCMIISYITDNKMFKSSWIK